MIKFIIDTDSYSGNFEREMCAYSTGHLRDCGVGHNLVDETIRQIFASHIQKIKDERDCMTPVEIATTPGFGNNGLGFCGDGSAQSFKKAKESYIKYRVDNDLKDATDNVNFYKGTKYDNTYNLSELKRIQDEIAELKKRPEDTFLPYPAYQSVCIFFKTLPEELVEILKTRTKEYADGKKIKILNYRIVDETKNEETAEEKVQEVKTSLKVKLTAHDGCIIIETVDPEESDKDFLPAVGSRIGCSLSNLDRLGISDEAYELLESVKKNRDAIGDFMWDNTSFSWIGGSVSIKDVSQSEAARDFRISKKFISIPNEVTQQMVDAISEMKRVKEVDYNDVKHELWITVSRSYGSKFDYRVESEILRKNIYDNKVVIVNYPEGLVKKEGGATSVKTTEETRKSVKESVLKIFENKDTISEEKHMDVINRFFEMGFSNNLMRPHKDYYRLAFVGTQKEILEKLNQY